MKRNNAFLLAFFDAIQARDLHITTKHLFTRENEEEFNQVIGKHCLRKNCKKNCGLEEPCKLTYRQKKNEWRKLCLDLNKSINLLSCKGE